MLLNKRWNCTKASVKIRGKCLYSTKNSSTLVTRTTKKTFFALVLWCKCMYDQHVYDQLSNSSSAISNCTRCENIILTLCPGNATSGFIVIAILATDCAARSAPFSVF